MPIPMSLMVGGSVLQIAGQWAANYAQSQSELANARYYQEEADYARDSMFRQLDITSREYEMRKGAQVSAAARGGVDVGSGSIAGILAATSAAKIEELIAVRKKGKLDIELARLRGAQSQGKADMLASPTYNLLQAGATGLNNYTNYVNNKTADTNSSDIKPSDMAPITSRSAPSNLWSAPPTGPASYSFSGYQSRYLGLVK